MKRLAFVLVSVILFMVSVSVASAEELVMWGSTTCQKRIIEPTAALLEKETGIKVTVQGVGTGKELLALLDGKTKVALTSNDLKGTIVAGQKVLAEEKKPEAKIPENLQFHQIIEDVIVPIVNEKNKVDSLTWEQLKDMNTGKIKNWKEVGGEDMPVIIITSHAGSSTKEVFQHLVMKKEDYDKGAKEVQSTRNEIDEVAKFKGAVGAVSEAFVKLSKTKVKVVKTAVISRPLALVTIGAPDKTVQTIIDFLKKPETQKHFE